MTWTASNMLSSLTDSTTGNSFALAYDTNRARIRQCAPNCSSATSETDYVNDPVTGTMEEVVNTGGTGVTWNDYIQAAGQIVAMRTQTTSSTTYLYFASDQLGSITLITDSTGAVIGGGRQAYDSWGLRRNASDWTPASSCNAIASATTRGYTGQEEIDGGCLVNLNGRIYDPTIGRFLSADPYVPDPLNTQSFNRYGYVLNNPLSAIDPSGYAICIIGTFDVGGSGTTTVGQCGLEFLISSPGGGSGVGGDFAGLFAFPMLRSGGGSRSPHSCNQGNLDAANRLREFAAMGAATGLAIEGVGVTMALYSAPAAPETAGLSEVPGGGVILVGGLISFGAASLDFAATAIQGSETGNYNNEIQSGTAFGIGLVTFGASNALGPAFAKTGGVLLSTTVDFAMGFPTAPTPATCPAASR
jgi:RHS repeat-associated protein